ncbi:hypothetical protein PVAP13_1KG187831 [Panicum virgatum]|uniref:RNase H type-1 domain-containing protein n=1 Tax=Panicum virgatum TaxID=38727 RepID=A0A8T0XH47_PANVG|nr:hypothetical protein PVAP13_1KG187831 [Panicum virgatum]
MGFKDLRLFNQALLAMQAWRLMEYPDSLCAHLLKARYYPRGCLVDTSFCSNASSTWQSILHGLELLKQGVIWRIGDGRKVRIWRDPWIPRELSLRVTTTKGRQRSKWVAELLDANGRQWDFNKLIAMFNPADADAIARIKIPTHASEDVLAWHFDRTVKIFAWKLSKDILPTKNNKFKRKLEADGTCDLCGLASETSFHAVVTCQQAYNLRQAMREHWELPAEHRFAPSGPDWLLVLLDGCTSEQKENTLLMLWRAWLMHNNITHESGPTGLEFNGKGKMQIGSAQSGLRKEASNPRETWSHPSDGWIKLNVDASFVDATGCAGTMMVARDSEGRVKFTAWRALFNCASAAEAEAHACVEGLRLASQWCHHPIIRIGLCSSELGFIIAEGKELSQLLLELKIVKVKRDCNKVAHELAALARRNTHSAVWLGQAPACAIDIINADCIQPPA